MKQLRVAGDDLWIFKCEKRHREIYLVKTKQQSPDWFCQNNWMKNDPPIVLG